MYVKVCGITSEEDAHAAADAGVDIIGLNLISASKRCVQPARARSIIASVSSRVTCVAVVADLSVDQLRALCREVGAHRLQLHGSETRGVVRALAPLAYQARRIGSEKDIDESRDWPGHPLLVDAKVEGRLGGTGHALDWPPLRPLARLRPLIVAGGLTPDNVGRAVEIVQPYGVDTASGVEVDGDARRKDPAKMRAFVESARAASHGSHDRGLLD